MNAPPHVPLFLVTAAIVFQAGCSREPELRYLDPDDRQWSRTEGRQEWRDAWMVPAGAAYAQTYDGATVDSAIRLGVLDTTDNANRISVDLLYGERIVRQYEHQYPEVWIDLRFDLEEFGAPDGPVTIRLRSDEPFWMSACELLPRNTELANVLIFMIDTLRRDHMSVYGYERETTPRIAEFAKDAVRFTGHVAASSWTRPSVASLLTSTAPGTHGGESRVSVVRTGLPWLPATLADAGYETQAFMSNPNLLPIWGIGDEFHRLLSFVLANEVVVEHTKRGEEVHEKLLVADDHIVVGNVIQALKMAEGRPWFMYVHTMAPHYPYDPPDTWTSSFSAADAAPADRTQQSIDAYDDEIAYVDNEFGKLMDELKRLDLYDNTLVVLLSDHGEAFAEHDTWMHGSSLYREQLDVPLVIKFPGQRFAGTTVAELVDVVDIAPTILDALGVPPNPRFEGASILPVLESGAPSDDAIFSSLRLDEHRLYAIQSGHHKHIRDERADEDFYFDLKEDPNEQRPLQKIDEPLRELANRARQVVLQGQQGLHVLIVNPPGDPKAVSGVVSVPDATQFDLRFRRDLSHVEWDDNGAIRLRIDLEDAAEGVDSGWAWTKRNTGGARNYAHLFVPMKRLDPVKIRITTDEAPVGPENVYIGASRANASLDGAELSPASLLAAPIEFDPVKLPLAFGIYVYAVADPERIVDDELEPGVREALQALGYVE